MYHIVSDSGCDLFELNGVPFSTAALTISTDSENFIDDETLNVGQMIETLLHYKGRSYTSCPSVETWMKAYDFPDGSVPEEIYVVTLTSGISGTYNSACLAKEMYLEKNPETKIFILDSLSVGPNVVVLLEKIAELKAAGKSFEEVVEYMTAYNDRTRLFFAFKSLHNLAQNGRVNKLAAKAAGVLGISLVGTASEAGEVQPTGKVRGDKRVIEELYKNMVEAGYKGGKVRLSNTENPEIVRKMEAHIRKYYPEADILSYPVRGLCAYYCERGGMCIGCEVEK